MNSQAMDPQRENGAPARARKPRADGERSRQAILGVAADMASTIGLDGLSIGGVAAAAGLSKGGVSAHFASKAALQLATIEYALGVFGREVIEPAMAGAPGEARLRSLCENDLSYIERRVFPGGCFFSAVAAEFCAREGPVKGRIAESSRWWMGLLEETVADGQRNGELDPALDPAQLAFELNGLIVSANFEYMLHADATAIHRARTAIAARIAGARP